MTADSRKSLILRMYSALARGVHFSGGRYTDERMFADIEEGLEGRPIALATVSADADDRLRRLIYAKWGAKGLDRFDRAGGFDKPNKLQNALYSRQLQRVFGINALKGVDGFTSEGVFRLADGYGFYVPIRRGRTVTELKFFGYSVLRPQKERQ